MPIDDYYRRCFFEYHKQTFHVDPSSFLSPLEKQLKPRANVLDVGCGSGRDLLWFKERDYTVVGFEKSKGLAALARKIVGCEVIEGDFETYDFSRLSMDAILLVGALVHLPYDKFKPVFKNITTCLKKKGKVLVSMKEGRGFFEDEDGRIFYLWQDDDLREVFTEIGCKILEFKRQVSLVQDSDTWLGYVLERKND
jgi:SAM-dependent methyltransferase